MFFFSQKNKEETIAVFDIASGSVGGAIVLMESHKKPTIISSFRCRFIPNGTHRPLLQTLQEVAQLLQKDIHAVPDKVFAVIASPWSTGELRRIQRHRKEGFVFTESYAKELIKEEISKFKKQHTEFDEIIDRRVVNVLLNGYEVQKPHGKRVKELELQIFLSLSSEELVERVEEVITQTYDRRVKCTSSLFSDFLVVRDVFDGLNDFVIVDIHEESTEVSVMRNDFLVGTSSFPYGKSTLVHHIAKSLGKDAAHTASLLAMYRDGHLDESYAKQIEQIVRTEGSLWTGAIKKVFRSLFVDLLIPHDIFLITDPSSETWFLHLLQKDNFSEFTTTENSFNVILANSKNLHDFYATAMNIQYDARLTIQSIFINNISKT